VGRVKVDIYKREREFHFTRLSDVDVVKGLITLKAQLDIYNDFMQDSGGKLGVSNFKNVNQEIVVLFSDLDILIEKAKLIDNQSALVKLLGSGLMVEDIAELLMVETRRIDRSVDKICRKIIEQNNMEWLRWVHMNYIESEWKTCRVCGEQYPATEMFFHKHDGNEDGLRNDCVVCKRRNRRDNYCSLGTKMAENEFPSRIIEGLNDFTPKPKKVKEKKKKPTRAAKEPEGMKLILPDGTKTILPNTKDVVKRKMVVDEILEKYKRHIEAGWDDDRVRVCLDVLGYYLCKPTEENVDTGILSRYKMREMNDGSRKHITFSSLSKRQRAALGLLDFDDSTE